jgi:hypothetical protein
MRIIKVTKRQQFDDVTILKTVLQQPSDPRVGLQLAEIRKSLKIMDRLDLVVDGELRLEDAEWEYLKQRYSIFPFALAHSDIAELADAIENAVEKR